MSKTNQIQYEIDEIRRLQETTFIQEYIEQVELSGQHLNDIIAVNSILDDVVSDNKHNKLAKGIAQMRLNCLSNDDGLAGILTYKWFVPGILETLEVESE